jgi:hypothetical protein
MSIGVQFQASPQLFSFHQCSVHVFHSSAIDAVILAIDRIFKYIMYVCIHNVKFCVKLGIITAESY